MQLSYKLKGSTTFIDLTSPYKIDDITKVESFHAKCSFVLEDNIDPVSGAPQRTVEAGNYYLIDLPEKLIVSDPASGEILGKENKAIANYSFTEESPNNWKIKIEFTDYINNLNEYDIHGEMELDFTLDLNAIGEGSTSTISIPIDNENNIDIEVTNPVPPPTKPVSLTKTVSSYNHQTRELVWKIKMMPDTGVFSGCVFTDTIDISRLELKSVKHGSKTLVQGTDGYEYDPDTGEIKYTIPEGRNGSSYQNIVITTEVKRSVYGNLSPTTVSNQANLSGGEDYVDIDSNTVSRTITPDWFGKSGTLFEGNKIKWTLTANTTRQNMYNAVITDNFQADVKLDKNTVMLGSTLITVYDDSHTPANDKEVYGIYTKNPDGTSALKIYLPRGKTNASDAKQTVTFVTEVVSPGTVVAADPVYNNTATLDANYVTDGNGEGTLPTVNLDQVGVAVPYISVVKGHRTLSEDDLRNGTITWTITAASNLSDYGKSTIVDTLPADQDFFVDQDGEVDEVYWGTQKINSTTEPKAEISANGRKLTITFNTTYNALRTQQTFTVKTKIKQQEYGQNLKDRVFRNEVRGALLSASTEAELDHDSDTDSVTVQNTVIAKSSTAYNSNITEPQQGHNPRVDFSVTINSNLMPLSDVVVVDDLNRIKTEFRKNGETAFTVINGVKWTYMPGTLVITRDKGSRDSFNLDAIAQAATYIGDILTVDFGSGVAVNDKYVISFTAELDVAQNEIFKQNGVIRCRGNIADIEASGLKTGIISSPETGYSSEVKNEILGKSGVHMVAEQQVVWTIHLNQHRVALDNSRVVDVLPLGLTLDPTSIKLYKNVIGSDGNFIADSEVESSGTPVDFTYTCLLSAETGMEGRYTFTVQLPDNKTDYILRFATDIDRNLLGKKITNSAYYVGESYVPDNTDTSVMTLSSSSGGGSTTKSSVTVYKKSKDTGLSLDAASFTLHWLRNGDPEDTVFVRTLSTTNGSVIFCGLTKGQKYTITEVTAPDGYLLDNPGPVTVIAPLEGTGDAEPLTFYNTPEKTGGWTPAAIKKLDGKSIIHSFNFEIADGQKALLSGTTRTKLANGDYTVAFSLNSGIDAEGVLNFTDSYIFDDPGTTEYLADTKTFYLREIASDLPGYGFDTTVYPLVVKIYNVKGQEHLKIIVEDDKGNVLSDEAGNIAADKIPVFLNTYRANGGIVLSAEKTVAGHALAADQFSFELYEGDALLQTAKNGDGMLTGGNTYKGNVYFNEINYTQNDVGIKTYRIVEKNTSLPGYTYDAAAYTVTVKIEDNDDGSLTSSIQSIQKTAEGSTVSAEKVAFTNTYTTSDVAVDLAVSKTLSGRVIEDGQFTFKLIQEASDGTFIQEIGTVTNTGENAALPKLTFKQADIGKSYYYKVTEENGGQSGYTYDTSEYTVQIDIFDNDDGTLTAVKTITKAGETASSIAFANSYHASGATVITAEKRLTGKALPDSQFAFSIQRFDPDTDSLIGDASVVRNTADGGIIFPELSYTEADAGKDFYYRIAETDEGVGGYTYDQTVYTVCVSVSDNGDGTLDVQQHITGPDNATEIIFANSYAAADTYAEMTAQKILNGRILEEQQFTFVLNQVTDTGEFVREIQRIKNGADGLIAFDNFVYTQDDMGKTYYYQISESDDENPGYGYDSSVYNIKVDVVDNNDGTLTAGKTLQKDGETVLSVLFTNAYTTTDASVQFAAQKTLTGRDLTEGQFGYRLTLKGDGDLPDILIEEVTNAAGGQILFAPLTYTQSDMGKTFIYTIAEINDQKPGYKYDDTVYTVEVKVIDNGDGTLSAKVMATMPGDGGEALEVDSLGFSNVYTAKGSVIFTAKKELVGLKLKNKQFAFVLTDEEGNILQTVYNDADGNIRFSEIVFDQDQLGEYHYSIYEILGNAQNYTYDKTVYRLTVIVTDNGDGTLHAATSITGESGSERDGEQNIRFVNEYHKPTESSAPAEGSVPSETPVPSVPKTGDGSSVAWCALLALLSLSGLILIKRKGAVKQ